MIFGDLQNVELSVFALRAEVAYEQGIALPERKTRYLDIALKFKRE